MDEYYLHRLRDKERKSEIIATKIKTTLPSLSLISNDERPAEVLRILKEVKQGSRKERANDVNTMMDSMGNTITNKQKQQTLKLKRFPLSHPFNARHETKE